MRESEALEILERLQGSEIRIEEAAEALRPAAGWDQEPPMPDRLKLYGYAPIRVIRDSEDHGWFIAEAVALTNPDHPGPEWQAKILAAMVAAYNREREEERIEAALDDAKLDEGLARICREEIDAEVQRGVQDERDRCERIVFALKTHFAEKDAIDGFSVRDLIEQHRLAIEQGTTHEQDLPPLEEARWETFMHGEEKGATDERARCLSILNWLLGSIPQGWDYARRLAEGARHKVASGASVPETWTGADDLPNPEADAIARQALADARSLQEADRWQLEEPLRTGYDLLCAGSITGPDGAYCDFGDSKGWTDDEVASMERLLAEANAAEVYRKALEPLARLYAQVWGDGFSEVDTKTGRLFLIVEPEHKAALRAACRLLGLLCEDGEGVKPEAPAG